jgi:hypothetical protein
MGRILSWWCIAAVLCSAVAVVVVPANLIEPWGVVAIVILLMPGVRIALAPLMLDWDRHR